MFDDLASISSEGQTPIEELFRKREKTNSKAIRTEQQQQRHAMAGQSNQNPNFETRNPKEDDRKNNENGIKIGNLRNRYPGKKQKWRKESVKTIVHRVFS